MAHYLHDGPTCLCSFPALPPPLPTPCWLGQLWCVPGSLHFPFLFLFFNGYTCGIWRFLVYGLNWSCSWGLCHSNGTPILATSMTYAATWGKAVCLTHWGRPGIKPASSQRQRWVLSLLNHNRNSHFPFLISLLWVVLQICTLFLGNQCCPTTFFFQPL